MHGEVRYRLFMYFSLRKTCMRCLLYNLALCPTHSSAILKFALWSSSLGSHFSFSFLSSHLWHLCYNPRGTRTSLDRSPFSTRLKSLGFRMVQTLLFFVCLAMVRVFLLQFSLAGRALQPMCPLFFCTCNLHDFHEDPRGLFQPDWFCDSTASDLCSQHLQYSPWIVLQQHFTLFLSSLCGGLGWLLTPSNHPTSLVIQGAEGYGAQSHIIWIIKSLARCRRIFGWCEEGVAPLL